MRRLLVPLLLAAATLAHAEDAAGACAAAVVVDGRVLLGSQVPHPDRLPPRAGERDAIYPACNDGGPIADDHEGAVTRLRGVPPRIAVAGPRSVYVDDASLTVLGTHPLHAAMFGNPQTPSYRENRRCRPFRSAVRGEVVAAGALRIRTADRTVFVSVDAGTRFSNRPSYEPVRKGQRLRLATSRCGPRRVADRVTFVGPTPAPAAYRSTGGSFGGGIHLAGWQLVLILLFGSATALIAVIWRYVGR